MADPSSKKSEVLRSKLEFPIWHAGFTKSYNAWSNAPSDLKTPLLLTGSALAKAESWLIFNPEKLTASQKRYIMRSVAHRAKEPFQRAAPKPAPPRKRGRSPWRAIRDRPMWQLLGVTALGLWYFVPTNIQDTLERALNSPESYRQIQQLRAKGKSQPTQPIVVTAERPVGTSTPQSEAPERESAAAPEAGDIASPVEMEVEAAPPVEVAPPPAAPVSRAARIAGLAREKLDVGQARAALLLGIEAAEVAIDEGDVGMKAADAAVAILFRTLATRERLGALAVRSAITPITRFCGDAKGLLTLAQHDSVVAWPEEGARRSASLDGKVASLAGVGMDHDCRRFLLPNEDFNVEVRALGNGRMTTQLIGHEGTILSASFSPDGNSIVTASQDSTSRVWDARTGRQRALLSGHDWHVVGAEFSPDGRHVLTAASDNTARIWDAATGRQIRVLGPHQGVVTAARFDADGRHILTTSWDGAARLWDAMTGQALKVITMPGGLASAVMSRDASRIAAIGIDGGAHLWDATTGAAIRKLTTAEDGLRALAFSSDGRWLASLTWDGRVEVHNGATGAPAMTLSGGSDRVIAMQFGAGARTLAAVTDSGERLVWPLFATQADAIEHAKSVAPACLSADERSTLGLEDTEPAWCKRAHPRDAALSR